MNHLAYERNIVIHGAKYATAAFAMGALLARRTDERSVSRSFIVPQEGMHVRRAACIVCHGTKPPLIPALRPSPESHVGRHAGTGRGTRDAGLGTGT